MKNVSWKVLFALCGHLLMIGLMSNREAFKDGSDMDLRPDLRSI